jgi:hypothetical protein
VRGKGGKRTKGERNFSIRERSKKQRGKLEENNKRTGLVLEEEKDWEQGGRKEM